MKVAILSDIHGNKIALEEVIKDAKEEGVEKYLVIGDMITDLPFTNEVLDTIKSLTTYVIKGNREQYLIEKQEKEGKPLKEKNSIQNSSIQYCYHEISKENLEYIKQLPKQREVAIEGVTFDMVHASFGYLTKPIHIQNKEEIEEAVKQMHTDILVCGHTHRKAGYCKKDHKVIISAGTVGLFGEIEGAQYVIVTVEKGKIQDIEVRTVSYDLEKLADRIRESDILQQVPYWTNLIYAGIYYHRELPIEFVAQAMKEMRKKNEEKEQDLNLIKFNVIDDDVFLKVIQDYKRYFLL